MYEIFIVWIWKNKKFVDRKHDWKKMYMYFIPCMHIDSVYTGNINSMQWRFPFPGWNLVKEGRKMIYLYNQFKVCTKWLDTMLNKWKINQNRDFTYIRVSKVEIFIWCQYRSESCGNNKFFCVLWSSSKTPTCRRK